MVEEQRQKIIETMYGIYGIYGMNRKLRGLNDGDSPVELRDDGHAFVVQRPLGSDAQQRSIRSSGTVFPA